MWSPCGRRPSIEDRCLVGCLYFLLSLWSGGKTGGPGLLRCPPGPEVAPARPTALWQYGELVILRPPVRG